MINVTFSVSCKFAARTATRFSTAVRLVFVVLTLHRFHACICLHGQLCDLQLYRVSPLSAAADGTLYPHDQLEEFAQLR